MASVEDGIRYAERVISGEIPAHEYVQMACQRHFKDLERVGADDFPYHFDVDLAQIYLDALGLCRHWQGKWAGQPFEAAPWQAFGTTQLYGWVHNDEPHFRRFRTCYIEVPKKNGKSTWISGLGVIGVHFDGEPGAEVYAAATRREQARIVWKTAAKMVGASASLRQHIKVFAHSLVSESTNSKFEPLGADADEVEGRHVSMALVDELHLHKNRDLYDNIETAMGARDQPLLIAITTAGLHNRFGVCMQIRDYTTNVLTGVFDDDSHFGMIYTVDVEDKARGIEGDDPFIEATWRKANPNYGVSVNPEEMRRLAKKAANDTSALNSFLCKRLNIWTSQHSRWIDPVKWQQSGTHFISEELEGRKCFAGLDMSSNTDLTAFALVFPPSDPDDENAYWYVICRYWCPEDKVHERSKSDHVPYDVWTREGYMIATEGNVIDERRIKGEIVDTCSLFAVQEFGFDPWKAVAFSISLGEEGLPMVEVRQGHKTLSEACNKVEKLVLAQRLAHGGHPVLAWNAGNVTTRSDPNGNIIPDKEKSTERIDGISALVTAMSRALVDQNAGPSDLERFGVRFL